MKLSTLNFDLAKLKHIGFSGSLYVIIFLVGILSVARPAHAFTLFMESSTSSPLIWNTSNVGNVQLDVLFNSEYHADAGAFYFIGSYRDGTPDCDPVLGMSQGHACNDWTWGGSYNGIAGGRSPTSAVSVGPISAANIPSASSASDGFAGNEITGHDDLYMCIYSIFSSGGWVLYDEGVRNFPCMHWHWDGYSYTPLNATTTAYIVATNAAQYNYKDCQFSSLNVGLCVGDLVSTLFIPQDDVMSSEITILQNNVLTKWPVGYITDFVSIVSTSTNPSLPVIDVTLPSGLPFSNGQHLHLDPTHSLDYILNATTSQFNNVSASSTQTFYQITEVYWEWINGLAFLFYVVYRLMGLRSHTKTNIT